MIAAILQAFKKTLLLKPAPLLGFSIPCKKNFVECLEVKNCPPYVCPMGSESRTPNFQTSHTMQGNTLSPLAEKVAGIAYDIQQVQDAIDFDQSETLWHDVSDIKSDLQRLLEKLQDQTA